VYAALILPPAVIATGWFIALNRFGPGTAGQALLVIALNALMALPYVYNVLRPAMQHNAANHDRICASLGIAGFNRFRRVDLPVMRRPLLLAAVVAMIVAMGDLTAVLLFGSGSIVTLPTHIYQLMGAYRLDQAASTALLLAMLAGALLWMAEALSDD
jgi:thiamine transport system permease protein